MAGHRLTLVLRGPNPPVLDKAADGILAELVELAKSTGWTIETASVVPIADPGGRTVGIGRRARRLTLVVTGPEPTVTNYAASNILAELLSQARRAGWTVEVGTVVEIDSGFKQDLMGFTLTQQQMAQSAGQGFTLQAEPSNPAPRGGAGAALGVVAVAAIIAWLW